VDTRLRKNNGRSVKHLRRRDLPELAKALVSVAFKQGRIVSTDGSPPYVRLHGATFDVLVSFDDWKLIQPYIDDNTFNPLAFPGARIVPLNNNDFLDESVVDLNSQTFYNRVLGTLWQLFPDEYPTSSV